MTEQGHARGILAGTMVLTPTGPAAVEGLRPGMMVIALSGRGAPFQPLQAVRKRFAVPPLVRIRAGALDDGTPLVDLVLGPDHGVWLDRTLMAAAELVDGAGIVWETTAKPALLVELVLRDHEAILAAGCAVESARPAAGETELAIRAQPGAALRAQLAWRAERMGWRCGDTHPWNELMDDQSLLDCAFVPPLLQRQEGKDS